MNEDSLNDPRLQSFEARLAAAVPQTPLAEQQELLYRCGFAAGKQASGRAIRRWQALAAAVVVIGLGWNSLSREQALRPEPQREPAGPTEVTPSLLAQVEIRTAARQGGPLALDAWRTPPEHTSLAEELARFERTDPASRSLTVGALTRALVER